MANDEAYRKAEKKIDQARLSRATELALSRNQLTELPDPLAQLTQSQSLGLPYNELTALPGPDT